MPQIVRHLHPEMTATNTADVDQSNPESHLNSTQDVTSPAGHAYRDQKRDKKGLSPVQLKNATIFHDPPVGTDDLIRDSE
jgi:hypothetical protein